MYVYIGKIYKSTQKWKVVTLYKLLSDLERMFWRNILPDESNAVNAYLIFGRAGWASEISVQLNRNTLNGQGTTLTNTPAHLPKSIPIRGYTQVVTWDYYKILTKYLIGSMWKFKYLYQKNPFVSHDPNAKT